MTSAEMIELVSRMDSGELPFCVVGPTWDEVYAGNVVFRLEDGREVVVFNDCDEWDYCDCIREADGTVLWESDPDKDDELQFANNMVKNEQRWVEAPACAAGPGEGASES